MEVQLSTPTSSVDKDQSVRFSPGARANAKRSIAAKNRSQRIKASLVPWCVALVVILVEIFTFYSSIGCFLLEKWLPSSVVVLAEYALLAYILTVNMWITYELLMVSPEKGFMHASFGIMLPSPYPHSKVAKSPNLLETSASGLADSSWVDDHHFGKLTEDSPSLFRSAFATPNRRLALNFIPITDHASCETVTKSGV
ncbi:unnamed protein product [Heligmosomoides polygyrus]|uniref:Palmitoyltransferase n=1 Tax=Heligmosomoides polygyrus TaxID=6339 RepID=A0A183GXH7_HELPZ|nr:unnamed protein product [Heligmosomoides polygyrus]